MKRYYCNKANPCSIKFPIEKYKCDTKVAILLATYNCEKYLSEQIDSIIDQDYSDWTLFIRDDGSTDSTTDIINCYLKKYPEKIVIIDSENKHIGCSNNFYEILFSVSASYYMFCDQDDVWSSKKISSQISELNKEENIYGNIPMIVGCDSFICDSNLNLISESLWETRGIDRTKLLRFNRCAVHCPIGGAEMIFNNEAKNLLINNIDNDFTYDHWLLLNVVRKGFVKLQHECLRYYRQHEKNVIGSTVWQKRPIIPNFTVVKRKFRHYREDYRMLKDIGYGNCIKYIYYKISCMYICKLFPSFRR